MRLPGNGNVMMGTDLLKKTTDALNENIIAGLAPGAYTRRRKFIMQRQCFLVLWGAWQGQEEYYTLYRQ